MKSKRLKNTLRLTTLITDKKIRTVAILLLFQLTPSLYAKDKNLSTGSEFIDNLYYVGVILEDSKYYTWGTSVVQGRHKKFHMFSCQWELKNGFHNWHRDSMVNHYVSKRPTGPYTFVNTVVSSRPSEGKEGAWNNYTAHNPEVKVINGHYVLTYISYPRAGAISEAKIGMKVAKQPEGPWQDVNKNNGLILKRSQTPGKLTYKSGRGTDNPSLVKFRGKYYLFFMYNPAASGDNTSLGVATSNNITGPYKVQQTAALLPGQGKKVEDLCVYTQDGNIHAVMCDNFGIKVANGGIYCEMDLPLFKKSGVVEMKIKSIAWDTRTRMFPNQDFTNGKSVYGGNKFERPKIVKLNGIPSYLFLPSGFNAKGNSWTALHGFKFKKRHK